MNHTIKLVLYKERVDPVNITYFLSITILGGQGQLKHPIETEIVITRIEANQLLATYKFQKVDERKFYTFL